MATSLALVVLLGLLFNYLFTKLRLPGFLGMLLVGVLIGPYCFNLLDTEILNVSADFRKIALITILLRAGLGISRENLNKVGPTAIKLSCIPGFIEGMTIAFISTKFLGFTFIQGGILGFIIGAVSPAVIVPFMLKFSEKGIGTNKGIPTLILAGSSIDDVFAITIFTTFLGLYSGKNINIAVQILHIPVSIILGIIIGLLSGLILLKAFDFFTIRDTKKALIILATAILITTFENIIKDKIEIAGLLGVMTIGFIILEKSPDLGKRLSSKLSKIWIFAEMLLFVLVGSQVNIHVAVDSGAIGIAIITIGLLGRSLGVIISLFGTNLTFKERMFCVISYTPKATVQAAIGAVPLALGIKGGELILAISVLSIITTAPLGAIAINYSSKYLLSNEDENNNNLINPQIN